MKNHRLDTRIYWRFGAALAGLLFLYAMLEAASPSLPVNDGTDTGVGCVDDCLEPIDPNDDKEPIPF